MYQNESKVGGFVAGTLVHTPQGLIPIEQIKVGDLVLSMPENGDGKQEYKKVINTFKTKGPEEIFSFRYITKTPSRFGDGSNEMETIYLTENNLMWVKRLGEDAALDLSVELDKALDPNQTLGWLPAKNAPGMESILFDDNVVTLGLVGELHCTDIENVFWGKPTGYEPGLILDFRNNQQIIYFIADRFDDAVSPAYMHSFGNYIIYGDPSSHSLVYNFIKMVRETGIKREFYGDAKTTAYNIEVEDFNTYYIGELGLWVHDSNNYLPEDASHHFNLQRYRS